MNECVKNISIRGNDYDGNGVHIKQSLYGFQILVVPFRNENLIYL